MNQTVCNICPHACVLNEERAKGKCLVREKQGRRIVLSKYGQCSAIATEPIEKRPFFHFLPGSKFLAVGFHGCSLFCKFCQNFSISQAEQNNYKVFLPEELIDLSVAKKATGIVFTYNEPTVHYEYLLDIGVASHFYQPKPYLALKTNGFAEWTTIRNLALFYSAWNVDIKGDNKEYERVCGGRLDPILQAIELLVSMDIHLEISYLVLPRLIDNNKHHHRICDFLAELDPWIPVHILNFFPFHKMVGESYLHTELVKVVDIFRVKMRQVYISNLFHSELMSYRNTYCPSCGGLLIKRTRQTTVKKLVCCGRKVKGIFLPSSE